MRPIPMSGKALRVVITLAPLMSVSWPSLAAQQTAILSVPGMTCPTCPITIKKSLMQLKGVVSVQSDFSRRETTVVFDDAQSDLTTLTNATRDAGFPSTAKARQP